MKHNKKTFWTLDRHHAAGFTLVELIVVIAILAILAGVAIPVYSGYIKKAERAADEQLLAAVNTAFAAACLQNGANHFALSETPEITLVDGTDGKKVEAVSLYNDDFFAFFAGNENAEFKVFESLYYNEVLGGFAENAVGIYSYGEGYIMISASDAQKLGISTFGKMGMDKLLIKVDDVTGYAAGISSDALQNVLDSNGFHQAAMSALGLSTPSELNTTLSELATELMEKDPTITSMDQAVAKVKANAAVLYAAQSTTKMDATNITTLFGQDGAKDQIITNLGTDTGLALSQAALAYGMYTAYANYKGDQELLDLTEDPMAVMNSLNDDGFQEYMNSAQGQSDLAGYLSAMNMINSSTGDSDAVRELMVNGFADPELIALLNQSVN